MAPGLVDNNVKSVTANGVNGHTGGMDSWGEPRPTRKLSPEDDLRFDPKLKPKAYHMGGEWRDSFVFWVFFFLFFFFLFSMYGT
jgi:hypothetical protein